MFYQDFTLTPDCSRVYLQLNQGSGFWRVSDWQGQDTASEGQRWNLFSPDAYVFLKDSSGVIAFATIDGKIWLAQRDFESGVVRQLLQVPKDLMYGNRVIGYSADGNGVFILVRQAIARPRTPPEDDHPVTEDSHTLLRVSEHYNVTREIDFIPKLFPDAYSDGYRDYVCYFGLKSRELRQVFWGNDIAHCELSPDGAKMVAVQNRHADPLQSGHGGFVGIPFTRTSADIYTISVPPLTEMPLVDLQQIKEAGRNAGWVDHRGEPIKPVVRDAGIFQHMRPSAMCWSPDGSKIAWLETGTNRTGDVWTYDLARKQRTNVSASIDVASVEARLEEPLALHTGASVSRRFRECRRPVWTADSQSLLFAAKGYLWKMAADGSKVENLSANAEPMGIVDLITGNGASNVPHASATGEILVKTTDRESLADSVAWFDPQTGRLRPIFTSNGYISMAVADAKGRTLFYSETTPTTTRQIHTRDLSVGAPDRQLTSFQSELSGLRVAEKQLLAYTTKSGRKAWAILHFPPGARREAKWPLIMAPQSSPRGSATELWSALEDWRQEGVHSGEGGAFTRAGFAVLQFDVPVATPGETDDLRRHVVEAFEAAADAAVGTGRIDGARIGLYGNGRNGAAHVLFTLMAIADTERYRAAVAFSGDTESLASLGFEALSFSPRARGWSSTSLGMLRRHEIARRIARLPEMYPFTPADYERLSPLAALGISKTPLLSLHPKAEPQEAWNLVFSARLPTHAPTVAAYTRSNAQRRALLWFNEHLRGGPKVSGRAVLPEIRARDLIEVPDDAMILEPDEPHAPELPLPGGG